MARLWPAWWRPDMWRMDLPNDRDDQAQTQTNKFIHTWQTAGKYRTVRWKLFCPYFIFGPGNGPLCSPHNLTIEQSFQWILCHYSCTNRYEIWQGIGKNEAPDVNGAVLSILRIPGLRGRQNDFVWNLDPISSSSAFSAVSICNSYAFWSRADPAIDTKTNWYVQIICKIVLGLKF